MWKKPKSIQFLIVMVFSTVCCLLISQNTNAAAYIKFDGIDGEVVDVNHEGWINLQSFSHSYVSQPADAATGRRGKVTLGDISCVKELDKSSPKLAEAVLKGQTVPQVTIELTRQNGEGAQATYLKYELKNVLVTSYQFQGSGQDAAVPAESFSLNFEEIKVTYMILDDTGSTQENVEYTWKVEEGES